jgi:hypothetical protein
MKRYECDRCSATSVIQMNMVEIPNHTVNRKYADLCKSCNAELIKRIAAFLEGN